MENTNIDVTTTLGDMKTKALVAPMLKLNNDDPFEIVSENDSGLVMVHYRNDADLEIFKNLRGVVVDTQTGAVVSTSFPHAPRVVTPSIGSENGNFTFGNFQVSEQHVRIKVGYEGTLLNVFKHGGTVYHSTRKRLDSSRSRWGNSKTFGQMFTELGGPTDLFDPEKDYSPYCHSFIIVHPDVLVVSREDVGAGYLIYLGPKKMYSVIPERCPYPLDRVDCELRVPETHSRKNPMNSKVFSPEVLSLDEANKHLTFGFYQAFEEADKMDSRLLPGEFVIVENTQTGDMYRVESPSYFWRSELRNNNPNLLHRFYELIDFSYLKGEQNQKFFETFPILAPYAKESIETNLPVIVWPQVELDFVATIPQSKETKMYNIWEAFLMVVPLHRQTEVLSYYENLVTRRAELVAWLIENSEKLSSLNLGDYSKRAQDILLKTRSFAENAVKKGHNFDVRTKERKTVAMMTRDNIRNFISKEQGGSLYRLVREMDRFKNPPAMSDF